MSETCCIVNPMSSRPLINRCLMKGSISKMASKPSAATVWSGRSMVTIASGSSWDSSVSHWTCLGCSGIGSRPIFVQFVVEDVGEGRGHDRVETPVLDTPRGVFARGPRSEIGTRHENPGVLVLGPVEDEGGIQLSVGVASPVVEQVLAVAGAFHPFQPLLGHDLICVHVVAGEVGQRASTTRTGSISFRSLPQPRPEHQRNDRRSPLLPPFRG